MLARLILAAVLLITLLSPIPAHAACTSPAGQEGEKIYNADYHVMQYCNGTAWKAMGKVGGTTAVSDVTSGIFGWWKLDDGGSGTTPTTAADSSGSGYTGTLTNGPTWTSSGKINNALTFNGTSQYVTLPSAVLPSNNNFTVSLWFKTTSNGVMISENALAPPGGTNHDPLLYAGTDGKLHGGIYTGSTPSFGTSATVNDGNWHLAALTVDTTGGTQKLYLDGSIVGSFSGTPEGPFSNIYLGTGETDSTWPNSTGTDTYFYFNGTIDDARIYNRVLSALEVRNVYRAGGGNPIVYTAKGTTVTSSNSTTTTITSVPLTAGDTVLVSAYNAGGTASSVTWNGFSLHKDASTSANTNGELSIWSYYSAATGAGDVVMTETNHINRVMAVSSVSGLAPVSPSALDQTAAAGSATATPSPSAGPTATTTVANEFLYGAIGRSGSGNSTGSWTAASGLGNGQERQGNSVTVGEGYAIVSSTGAYTAAKTGASSQAWNIAIATYEGASGHCFNPIGNEGEWMYNQPYHVMQYCDGNSWQAMGPNPGAGPTAVITRTAKGAQYATGSTNTISNVTLNTGDTLIVGVDCHSQTVTSVKWNNITMTRNVGPVGAGANQLSIYSLPNVTGATGNIVATYNNSDNNVISAAAVSGLASSPFDKSATATGSGTNPSAGPTATTSQASEILVGFAESGDGGVMGGTWNNSFTEGQAANGNQVTYDDGYNIVSSTGTYTASKTGITSAGWTAAIATYKAAQPVVTAKGTAGGSNVASLTIANVTLNAGDTLLVSVSDEFGDASVTWNGISLNRDSFIADGTSFTATGIWSLYSAAGGTGNIVASHASSKDMAIAASAVSNLNSSSLDQTAGATGNSTAPSSGPASTKVANEFLFGATVNGGTWSNSFTDGQTSLSGGSGAKVDEGYKIVSSTGAYAAAKTGTGGGIWTAVIATYTLKASGACANPVGNEGEWFYNRDFHMMTYCDGTVWREAGSH